MKKIIVLSLTLALLLSACGGAAVPAVPALEPIELFVTCADQRCDLPLLLGLENLAESDHIIRRVGGAAGLLKEDFKALKLYYQSQGMEIDTLNLITHLDDDCPACGGLLAREKQLQGSTVHPPEVDQWIRNNLIWSDPYQAGRSAGSRAAEALPGTEVNVWLQTNSSQRMIPVETVSQKVFTDDATWKAWPVKSLPSITSGQVEVLSVRNILQANETALPKAQISAQKLGYAEGQPFEILVLSTRTDAAMAIKTQGSFQVTVLPGQETEAVAQMTYGMAHGKQETVFRIVSNNMDELGRTIDALNESRTFVGLLDDTNWKGFVGADIGNSFIQLRYPGQPLVRLYKPIMGGSGPTTSTMTLPAVLDEATMAESFAKAGVPAEQNVILRALTKLAPYAGTTLRVIGYGFQIVAVVYVIDTVGNVVFAWGPSLQVPTGTYFPADYSVDPVLYEVLRVPTINQSGEVEYQIPAVISTGGQGIDLYQAWDQIQQRASIGEETCFGFVLDDRTVSSVPLVTDIAEFDQQSPIVVCPGEPVTPNQPGTIVFANVANGAQVTFKFDTTLAAPDWIHLSGNPAALSWVIPYHERSDITCTEGVGFVKENHFRIQFAPSCNWAK